MKTHALYVSMNLDFAFLNKLDTGIKYISDMADPCETSPCLNSGTCIFEDQLPFYSCHCLSYYTGEHCEGNSLVLICSIFFSSTAHVFVRVT